MKLIVGLGNPGRKYEGTRHNVGFRVVARLAAAFGDGKPKAQFRGEAVQAAIGGEKVLLLTPLTYMNLSGGSVREARDFYKLAHGEILVVCDDINLPLGKLRIRKEGSSGGQKGLESILQQLGGQDVPRLRIGVGPVPPDWDAADFVLAKFNQDEQDAAAVAIEQAANAAADWVKDGIEACMNRYN